MTAELCSWSGRRVYRQELDIMASQGIRDARKQRLNKFVFSLLTKLRLCGSICHVISVLFSQLYHCLLSIIFCCGFHMDPWGIHLLIALKLPFSDIIVSRIHVSVTFPMSCPWVSASHSLYTSSICCTWPDFSSRAMCFSGVSVELIQCFIIF